MSGAKSSSRPTSKRSRRPRALSFDELVRQVLTFRDERDWRQFHNPKDLAISISLEAAELLERFQWKSPAEVAALVADPQGQRQVSWEMADILILLISLADVLGTNLVKAAQEKLQENERRYPVERARGTARKYRDLAADDR
ncbi:MAG: nucleotide pyrophosphohydrolase [Candidatus Methylomirabilales bacterium]